MWLRFRGAEVVWARLIVVGLHLVWAVAFGAVRGSHGATRLVFAQNGRTDLDSIIAFAGDVGNLAPCYFHRCKRLPARWH